MQKTHLFVLSAAALVLLTTSCSKLKALSADNFSVVPNPLETQQGGVPATINGVFPEKYMKKKAVVTVIPELRYADGQVAQGQSVTFQGEKVYGNDQVISYRVGGRYTMKTNFDYLDCNKADMYLKFKARIGSKFQAVPAVKVAEGIVATSELYKKTLKTAQAAIAPDAFQRINAQKQEASVKFLIQQATLRKSELKNNSVRRIPLPPSMLSTPHRTGRASRNWSRPATFRTRMSSCASCPCIRTPRSVSSRSRTSPAPSANWPTAFCPSCAAPA